MSHDSNFVSCLIFLCYDLDDTRIQFIIYDNHVFFNSSTSDSDCANKRLIITIMKYRFYYIDCDTSLFLQHISRCRHQGKARSAHNLKRGRCQARPQVGKHKYTHPQTYPNTKPGRRTQIHKYQFPWIEVQVELQKQKQPSPVKNNHAYNQVDQPGWIGKWQRG